MAVTNVVVMKLPSTNRHSVGRKQAQGSTGTTLLVLIVGSGRALADRFVVFVGDPAAESGLQRVRFRSHQAGRPEQGFCARLPDVGTEESSADTRQDDGSARSTTLGPRNRRNLKIHERIMPNIGKHICRAPSGDRNIR